VYNIFSGGNLTKIHFYLLSDNRLLRSIFCKKKLLLTLAQHTSKKVQKIVLVNNISLAGLFTPDESSQKFA